MFRVRLGGELFPECRVRVRFTFSGSPCFVVEYLKISKADYEMMSCVARNQ